MNAKTEFLKRLNPLMKSLGFRKKNSCYCRVVGDVIQGMDVESICSGRQLRVNFDVFPLCYPIFEYRYIPLRYDYSVFSGGMREGKSGEGNVFSIFSGGMSWREFDPHNEESVASYIDMAYKLVEENIVPIFKKVDSAQKAFYFKNDIERRKSELSVNDMKLYWTCLKMRDYETPLMIRLYRKLQYIYTIDEIRLGKVYTSEDLVQKERDRFINILNKEVGAIEKLKNLNPDTIKEMIMENERLNIRHLVENNFIYKQDIECKEE